MNTVKYDPDIHHRKSIRLKGYDYSRSGSYFITICAENREHFFGFIKGGEICLSEIGKIVEFEWFKTPGIRKEIELGKFVIMSNHMHAIVNIKNNYYADENFFEENPLENKFKMKPRSLSSFIAGFKSTIAKRINDFKNTPESTIWQRNFYDHIIRNDREYENICNYIQNNPLNWFRDIENKQFCNMITEKQREEYYKKLIITKK